MIQSPSRRIRKRTLTHTPRRGVHSPVSLFSAICFGFGDTKFNRLSQVFFLDEQGEKHRPK